MQSKHFPIPLGQRRPSTVFKQSFKTIRAILFFSLFLISLFGCGGGSAGTGIGGGTIGESARISGVVVSTDGEGIENAAVTLLNTDESAQTDEAGAFELPSSFPGGDATFSIQSPNNGSAEVTVTDLPKESAEPVDLSIQLNSSANTAQILNLTVRAAVVRECDPMFLNTKTIKQTGELPDGYLCTIEAEIRSDGTPLDNVEFQLEHRGCSKDAPWRFSSRGVTGTSGPGTGELKFNFKDDEAHCVYRIKGPVFVPDVSPLSVQIHTLRKQNYDRKN